MKAAFDPDSGGEIAIVGSGNLAWHLAGVLQGSTVYFRKDHPPENWNVPLRPVTDLGKANLQAVILAVPDTAIRTVSESLRSVVAAKVPVIHTSGATPLDHICEYFSQRGVLWPIRSLRRGEPVKPWRDLPLVLQAEGDLATEVLQTMARSLSDDITCLDDRQRAQLHLAAVFSNNFVTALYEIAHDLCTQYGVPFDLLLPIIRNTALSQDGRRPADRQTGAAARGDRVTMQRHLGLLQRAEYRELYERISRLILQYRLSEDDPHLGREADDDL